MAETMKRGRSQVIWRYAPGATYRYNETGGWCETSTVTIQNASPLNGALARALAQVLKRWNAIGPSGFPDPIYQSGRYVVGEPFQVMYSLWPIVLTCRECGRVHWYQSVDNLQRYNPQLKCQTCKGRDQLRQVPYGYVCECGRKDSVYIPSNVPGHQKDHTVVLMNRQSFQDSYWYCRECKRPLYRTPKEGLGFRSCDCAPKKGKRGVLLEDSRVYYSQTLDLVDIEPKVLDRWRENSRFGDLLLGGFLRIPSYERRHILDLASWRLAAAAELSLELREMKERLVRDLGLSEENALRMVNQAADKSRTDPWIAYDKDLEPYRSDLLSFPWAESRKMVEYLFVRDEPSVVSLSLNNLITERGQSGDNEAASRLADDQSLASSLGLSELRIVQALPILLGGIGFSRYFAGPQDVSDTSSGSTEAQATLRSFPPIEGKIPIYVARNTTEGMFYELDPFRVAAYLKLNTDCDIPVAALSAKSSLRAWLLSSTNRLWENGESHYDLTSFEKEAGLTVDDASALVFGLLHTMSHVLKATAHKYVGIDSDALAEYLFPAQNAGLLYVSSHVEFTLGGIDSVFRTNLHQWLAAIRDYAGQCSFDPVCRQSGGACLACLYPKFGCGYFNRSLSRSYLLGGEVRARSVPVVGFWDSHVTKLAAQLLDNR